MMAGAADIDRPRVQVQLDAPLTAGDRIEFQRAMVFTDETGLLHASSTGAQQSSRLSSFLGANALLIIVPRAEPYAAGERVEALLLGAPAGAAS